MLSQWIFQSFCNLTACCVFREICSLNLTFKIITKVSTACFDQWHNRSLINNGTSHECNFRTVVDTRNSAECKHKIHVFCPVVIASLIALFELISRTVVMAVYINYIPCCIIVELVAATNAVSTLCSSKIPVHWEVDYVKTAGHCVIRFMVSVTLKKMVIAFRTV